MSNQPFAYKKGYVNFADCKIDLSMCPMIPRKETEFWVKKAIQKLSRKAGSRYAGKIDVLDIFSGSGCIGIAILKHIKNSRVTFAEIDKNLIQQIKINLKINKINPRRYKVVQSDIFRNIQGKYDYIFANPPYIPLKNKHLVQNSVYNYEPHLALFGGNDGLFYIRKFLKNARKFLKPNGKIYPVNQKDQIFKSIINRHNNKIKNAPLRRNTINGVYMEFDHLQKNELGKLLKKLNYKNFQFHKDQFKKWRWVEIFAKI